MKERVHICQVPGTVYYITDHQPQGRRWRKGKNGMYIQNARASDFFDFRMGLHVIGHHFIHKVIAL